jgi:ABC-type transport system substrate-binding protein
MAAISGAAVLNTMYDHFLWNNTFDNTLEPMLATEWNMSPDGKNWTFKLRKGVPFHSGREFTANDLRLSWEINSFPSNKARGGSNQQLYNLLGGKDDGTFGSNSGFENIEIVNDYEVIYHLNGPFIDMALSMGEGNGFMQAYDSQHWIDVGGEDGYSDDPIGTGPFKFVDLKIDQFLLVERFKNPGEDHWWQIPEFDEAQFFYVKEGATRMAMLLTEEVHLADVPALLIPDSVERGFKLAVSTQPGLNFFTSFGGTFVSEDPGYNPDNPFLIKEVREAINLAIDRQTLLDTFFPGRAVLGSILFYEPTLASHKAEWTPYEYNPNRARQLLIDAGFADGVPVEVWTASNMSGTAEAPDVIEAMLTMWEAVGFKMDLKVGEFRALLGQMRSSETNTFQSGNKGKMYAFRFGTRGNLGLLYNGWNRYLPSGNGLRMYSDETINTIAEEYGQSIDPVRRSELELAYGDHAYDNFTTIPLFWISPQAVFNPKILVEYVANHKNFGPVRTIEFVKAVRK